MSFCTVHLCSPLPCGSVVLHQVIETERWRCWVSYQLCCVRLSLRTNVMSVLLSTLSTTATCSSSFSGSTSLFLSLPRYFPSLSCHSWVCISPRLCLTYFHLIPLLCDYSGKVNAAPAESALMLSCQPSPAPLRLIPPSSSVTSSGHSQQRQPLAPTLTSHHFT